MDFDDTPEEAAYRTRARAFLERFAEPVSDSAIRRNRYSANADTVTKAREWQALKADHGFAGITWPSEWGGQGLPPIMSAIYAQEESGFAVPQGVVDIGLAMCLPTVIKYSPDQARVHAPLALRGETIWCQLFSEPGAGSDLAGLSTRAVKDGDHWVITGQKTWTSVAQFADYGLLLTRTDREVAKHAGLTAFFIDMRANGVEVRPIHQMTGHAHFNDVFLTEVRVPDTARLGAPGEGWNVANSTLSNERYATGEAAGPRVEDLHTLARTVATLRGEDRVDMALRERLADWYAATRGLAYTRMRILTAMSRGTLPGPEASIGKLVNSGLLQQITAAGTDLLGMAGGVAEAIDDPMARWFHEAFLYAPANRIAGGTDEILRNIIAERVLGLPSEIRVDRNIPFKDLPRQ